MEEFNLITMVTCDPDRHNNTLTCMHIYIFNNKKKKKNNKIITLQK